MSNKRKEKSALKIFILYYEKSRHDFAIRNVFCQKYQLSYVRLKVLSDVYFCGNLILWKLLIKNNLRINDKNFIKH